MTERTQSAAVVEAAAPPVPRAPRRGPRLELESSLFSLPALVLVAVLFVAPMCVLVAYSFWPTDEAGRIVHHFTTANYTRIYHEDRYVSSLLTTFLLVGVAAATTVAATFPLAYFVATKVAPQRRVLWILLAVMPFWTSYLIRVFSWINIFGDSGAIASLLDALGFATVPSFLGLGRTAIVVTFVYLLFPFAFLTSYVAIERMDPSLREAGADLGARPWQVLTKLTLPLGGGGLLAGFGFAFISMMGDYITPQLIGGTEGSLFPNLLVNQFGSSGQWGFGAVLALLMMVCVFALLALMRAGLGAQRSGEFTRRYVPSKAPLLRAYSLLFLAFLYAPIALVVLFAFNTAPYVGFPIQGLTTRWFEQVVDNVQVVDAFTMSLRVAGCAVLLATLLGVPAAVQLSRTTGRLRNLRVALLSFPLLVPPVVLGLGIIIGMQALGLHRGFATIVAAHALLILPLVVLIVMTRLEGLDRNQELAAMDLGATPWRAFMEVTLPQAAPAIAAAAMLGLALSIDEFILTFLITETTTTLPLYIYGSLRFQIDPSIDAIATLVLLLSFAMAALALLVGTGFRGRRSRRADGPDAVIDLLKV